MTPTPGPLQRCEWLYPPLRRPRQRQRTLGWLSRPAASEFAITTEHGEILRCPTWNAACEAVGLAHLTCFTSFGSNVQAFPWLAQAVPDPRATILISKRGIVHGVQVHPHRQYGAFINADSWGFTDLQSWDVSPGRFLALVRRFLTQTAVGDYDTLGAVGEQSLFRFWQQQGIRRVSLLHSNLAEWFTRFPAAGRILLPLDATALYKYLWEVDLRSAYPKEFARGVPWGDAWETRSEDSAAVHSATSHALYRVTLHDSLERGPVRFPVDGLLTYNPPAGDYEIPLWDFERESLRALGASCEWQHGYCWDGLGTQFAPFVDEWQARRDAASAAGDEPLAYLCKRAPNALLGKFGSGERYAIVPEEEASDGDQHFIMDSPTRASSPSTSTNSDMGEDSGADDLFFIHREGVRAVPAHWRHYIVSRVNHVLWTTQQRMEQQGNTVAMANTDALFITQPPLAADFGDELVWKVTELRQARLPYARAVIGWRTIGTHSWYDPSPAGEAYVRSYVQKLPGIPRHTRPEVPIPKEQAP